MFKSRPREIMRTLIARGPWSMIHDPHRQHIIYNVTIVSRKTQDTRRETKARRDWWPTDTDYLKQSKTLEIKITPTECTIHHAHTYSERNDRQLQASVDILRGHHDDKTEVTYKVDQRIIIKLWAWTIIRDVPRPREIMSTLIARGPRSTVHDPHRQHII